jgi:hypothetical protein
MSPFLVELAVAVLAGPLVVAGLAKLLTAAEDLSWPYDSGPLRSPHGPRVVGAGECVAAIGLVLLPSPASAALAFGAYGMLAVMAYRLRGQKCACFGAARLAAVGRAHIGGNLLGTVAAAGLIVAGLLTTPTQEPVWRAVVAGCAAAAVFATVLVLDRRAAAKQEAATPCTERVSGVRLYVSTSCPACRSLERLLTSMEPARRAAIDRIVTEKGDEVPDDMKDLGVPAAIALDAIGAPVCTPVSGIGAVKALIDTITISSVSSVGSQVGARAH